MCLVLLCLPFILGKKPEDTLRIASAHTDFPAIRVKPNPITSVKGYTKLNVEMYGGLIENTWLDRPLGAAGTVVLKGENAFDVDSVLVDTKRPIAIVPNLAIHMNRSVNDGVKLNRQKEMLPILMMDRKEKDNSSKSLMIGTIQAYSQNLIFNTMRGLRSWLMKSTVIHLKFCLMK